MAYENSQTTNLKTQQRLKVGNFMKTLNNDIPEDTNREWDFSINEEPQELRFEETTNPDILKAYIGPWGIGPVPAWVAEDADIMDLLEKVHEKGFYRQPAMKWQRADLRARHPDQMHLVEEKLVGFYDMRNFISHLDQQCEEDQGFSGSAYDEIDAELDAILEEEVKDPIPLFPEKQEAPADERLNALEKNIDQLTSLMSKFVANDWERSEQKAERFNPKDRLTTEQTAQLLGFSTVYTSTLARDGKLPAAKHCGAWYFERQGVADYLAQKKSGAA